LRATAIAVGAGQTTTIQLQIQMPVKNQGVHEGFVLVKSQNTTSMLRIPYWVTFGAPTVNAGGLVDGAGFRAPVAPGGIASLFGASMGAAGTGATTIPLPNDLAHTTVTVTQGSAVTEAATSNSVGVYVQ